MDAMIFLLYVGGYVGVCSDPVQPWRKAGFWPYYAGKKIGQWVIVQ